MGIWVKIKQMLESEKITKDDYIEWKFLWPQDPDWLKNTSEYKKVSRTKKVPHKWLKHVTCEGLFTIPFLLCPAVCSYSRRAPCSLPLPRLLSY